MASRSLLVALLALSAPGAALADPAGGASRPLFEVRARSEGVWQDGLPETGHALTVRPRLGWRSERRRDLQWLIEGEAVLVLDDRFSAPLRPDPARPVVGDGEAVELNRAQISWTGLPRTEIVAGRQRLVLGDGRLLGNSGWRQNEQTFDALRVTTSALPGVTLSYGYATAARRFPGEDHPQGVWEGAFHLMEAGADTPFGRLTGLVLATDIKTAPTQSALTWTVALQGSREIGDSLGATWRLDYGRQADHGIQPADFDLGYARVIGGLQGDRWSAQAGREWLEGNGAQGFQTPLGSNHAFLGWSDVIGATPVYGLTDDFLRGQVTLPDAAFGRPLRLAGEVHRFRDGDRAFDVGQEIDFAATISIDSRWSVELKAADFESERPDYPNATRAWLTLEYRY